MTVAFGIAAALLILLSIKSFRSGLAYLRFVRKELSRPKSRFTPFVSVIAPCRGLEVNLEENLSALATQKYPAFELIFVVDDKDDPAMVIIERVRSLAPAVHMRLVIAPKTRESSQKVENLREAVLHTAEGSRVFVFVDSDARPSPGWLSSLVAPLENAEVGAATGYRWFIPPKPTFASELCSAWNASIASALGPNIRSNFCWGGSSAIRREVFERLNIRERWRGTLSDDFTVTRVLKEARLPIVFVPQALTASVPPARLPDLLEFTNRQMQITRVYAPELWAVSLVGSLLFNLVMIWAVLILLLRPGFDLAGAVALVTLVLVSVLSGAKAWVRLKAVSLALPQCEAELRRQSWTQVTFWLFAPALFLCNTLVALFSRKVTWRGIKYELKSPSETVIIAD